ncbi:MAG: hypothetical protein WC867_02690 [Candidatus Pacearchaeota archaeon]|jgi:membrane protein DedA with SNARE-associated domain
MGFIESFVSIITIYPKLATTVLTFLFGDEVVYFLAFLSGQGLISIWVVLIFSLIGNGSCDIFWYTVARSKYLYKIKNFLIKKNKSRLKKEILLFNKVLTKKKMFFTLLVSKFFYGTRLLAIFYIEKKEKSFKKIILINTIANATWLIIMVPFIWLLGNIAFITFNKVAQIHRSIGLGVLLIILLYFLRRVLLIQKIKN